MDERKKYLVKFFRNAFQEVEATVIASSEEEAHQCIIDGSYTELTVDSFSESVEVNCVEEIYSGIVEIPEVDA